MAGSKTSSSTTSDSPLVVIALGNPGPQYEKTRHNAGWVMLDEMFSGAVWEKNSYANSLEAHTDGMVLVKPQTFMNESGKVIPWYMKKTGLHPDKVVVLHDEIDMPIGSWKFSTMRAHGGHNGIRSIEQFIKPVPRIRIGIGTPGDYNAKPNVLGNFRPDELEALKKISTEIKQSLYKIRDNGAEKAQSMYR